MRMLSWDRTFRRLGFIRRRKAPKQRRERSLLCESLEPRVYLDGVGLSGSDPQFPYLIGQPHPTPFDGGGIGGVGLQAEAALVADAATPQPAAADAGSLPSPESSAIDAHPPATLPVVSAGESPATPVDAGRSMLPLLSVHDAAAVEGSNLVFTISLSAAGKAPVSVKYQTANATATRADYEDTRGTLTFLPGETSRTVRVPTINDAINEGDENIWMLLSQPNGAEIDRGLAGGTIVDNDARPQIGINDCRVRAGETAIFLVGLNNPCEQVVTVDYAITPENGSGTAILRPVTGTITFQPGESIVELAVPTTAVNADSLQSAAGVPAQHRDFRVTLSHAVNGDIRKAVGHGRVVGQGHTQPGGQVVTLDAEDRTMSIAPAAATEGYSLYFSVTLSEVPGGDTVTVNWETSPATALSDVDYTSASGSITFSSNQSVAYIPVASIPDSWYETDETFIVHLSGVVGATITQANGPGTIYDDDSYPTVWLSGSDSDYEGQSVELAVTLSNPSDSAVDVNWYCMSGTANSGDYSCVTGSPLTFPAHSVASSIAIDLVDDDVYENTEYLSVYLSGASGASIGYPGTCSVWIYEDDSPPSLTIQNPAAATQEGPNATVYFPIALSGTCGFDVTVGWGTSPGTATAGEDYYTDNPSVTINAGSTIGSIPVRVKDDAGDPVREHDEDFSVALWSASGVSIGSPGVASATITDDEPVPSIDIEDPSPYTEGSGDGSVTLNLELSGKCEYPVSASFAPVPGTAHASDYYSASGIVYFTPGQTTKQIKVGIVDDSIHELEEEFSVVLSALNPEDATIGDGTATVTIEDDDPLIITVEGGGSCQEGSYAYAAVTLNTMCDYSLTVNWEVVPGTAKFTNGDYWPNGGSVVLEPFQTSMSCALAVYVERDNIDEGDEAFSFLASEATGGQFRAMSAEETETEGSCTVTISNSPPPPPPPGPPCDDSCSCDQNSLGNGINGYNGEENMSMNDFTGEGGCATGNCNVAGPTRAYSNGYGGTTNFGYGAGWVALDAPYMGNPSTNVYYVAFSPTRTFWFDYSASVYHGRDGTKYTLTYNSGSHFYTLAAPDGTVYEFHDFDEPSQGDLRGTFILSRTPGGVTTTATYNSDGTNSGRMIQLDEVLPDSGGTNTRSYTWGTTGGEAGRIKEVSLMHDSTPLRKVDYSYYEADEDYGVRGDLKTVTVYYPDETEGDTTYYRYYKDSAGGKGFANGLQRLLLPAAYAKAEEFAASISTNVEHLTDAQIANYTCYYYEYDANHKVTNEVLYGGSRQYGFTYGSSSVTSGYNAWQRMATETRADGSTQTVYYNCAGAVLLSDLGDTDGNNWITFRYYDGNGRLSYEYEPSAIDDYTPNGNGSLTIDGNANDGLGYHYTYDGYGYKTADYVVHGYNGATTLLRAYQYGAHDDGNGVTIHPVSATLEYSDGDTSTSTSYTYTYYDDANQVLEQVTTLPRVPLTQNGPFDPEDPTPPPADTRKDRFDERGNLTWSMDERGRVSYYEYDPATGAMTRSIQDVNSTTGLLDAPGWTIPGGGAHLVTNYEVDDLGRTIETLGPEFVDDQGDSVRTATWTGYLDAANQTRTAQGYAEYGTGDWDIDTLVGPVSISKYDADGRLTESIEATYSGDIEDFLDGASTPARANYTSWTANQYSKTRLSKTAVYYAIPPLLTPATLDDPDGDKFAGIRGMHYDVTEYGYNSVNRLDRVVGPGGTITRTVYDARGNVTETWVGTDETGYTAADPQGGAYEGDITGATWEYDPFDENGHALGFDGDAYVEVDTQPFLTAATGFGVQLLVCPSTIDGVQTILDTRDPNNLDQGIRLWSDDGVVCFSVDGAGSVASTNVALYAEYWQLVVAGYDPVAQKLRLTVDLTTYEAAATGQPNLSASHPLVLGNQADHAADAGLIGQLDDVRFYRQALTEHQAHMLFWYTEWLQREYSGFPAEVAHWKFDEGAGATVSGVGDNNLVQTAGYVYDNGAEGGDGLVTTAIQYVDEPTAGAPVTRQTQYGYTWQDQLQWAYSTDGTYGWDSENEEWDLSEDARGTYSYYTYDRQGRTTMVEQYHDVGNNGVDPEDDPTPDDVLIGRSETAYDDRGRVYQTTQYGVEEGVTTGYLTSNAWYDQSGNVVKSLPAGSNAFTKTDYDGLGRVTAQYVGYDLDEETGDLFDSVGNVELALDDDAILEQTEYAYDGEQVIFTTSRQRMHDESDPGTLQGPSGGRRSRDAYAAAWYDGLGRQTTAADWGANDGTVPTRSAEAPSVSTSSVHVTGTDYVYADADSDDDPDFILQSTDAAGHVAWSVYDAAGRVVKTIQNYEDGVVESNEPDEDVTIETTYTADGQVATYTAVNPATGDQVTRYVYGTTLADSGVARTDLLRAVIYPDSDDFCLNVARPLGDLDFDGNVDDADIDALYAAVDDERTEYWFDIDGDGGAADQEDVDALIHDVLGTEYGDVDMDYTLTPADYGTVLANIGSSLSGWLNGDLDGDGGIDQDDLDLFMEFALLGGFSAPVKVQTGVPTLSDGSDETFDRVEYTYNRAAEQKSLRDQNETVHDYLFDGLGRMTLDSVTTLGTVYPPGESPRAVEGDIRSIVRGYEVRGMLSRITTYDTADPDNGTAKSDVYLRYNDFGQLVADYQKHTDDPIAIDSQGDVTDGTPCVQYAYADGSDNTIRLMSITYPNGRKVHYTCGTSGSAADALSRVDAICEDDDGDPGDAVAEYTYLGLGTIVKVDYPEASLHYTLAEGTGADPYTGLDAWGRVVDLIWKDGSDDIVEEVKYGYDLAGNRLWRETPIAEDNGKDYDELYSYDQMYQLIGIERGNLDFTDPEEPVIESLTTQLAQAWDLDATGNWSGFQEDSDGDGDLDTNQTRDHNAANEITAIDSSSSSTAHDRAGNMIVVPKSASILKCRYDAWNRLTEVDDAAGIVVARYRYDGRGFRLVAETYTEGDLDETRHFYQSQQNQVLEERVEVQVGEQMILRPDQQFLWGLRYIDDLILRDRNADGNPSTGNLGLSGSGLEERLYAIQDANFNVTAIANTSGAIVERYLYDAYGNVTYLNSSFVPNANQSLGSVYSWRDLYTGRRLDPTDFQFYRARYYLSWLGRFSAPDPIGYRGGVNLYQYVHNRALTLADPTGNVAGYIIAGLASVFSSCVIPQANAAHARYPDSGDKFKHCWTSCRISKVCGNFVTQVAGLGKEGMDSLKRLLREDDPDDAGNWADSLDDLIANQQCVGWEGYVFGVAGSWIGGMLREDCDCCCRRKVGYAN